MELKSVCLHEFMGVVPLQLKYLRGELEGALLRLTVLSRRSLRSL